jgi:ATP-dependent helicase/DNAse subunit B
MLSEHGVPSAVTLSHDPAILHSTKTNQQLSKEGFDSLFADLEQTVSTISKEMKAGSAVAKPNPYADRIACEYCPFGAVCRAKQKS